MAAKIKTAGPAKHSRHSHKPKKVSRHDFEKVYWPYLPVLLVLILLFSIAAQSGMISATLKNPVGRVLDYATSMSISQLLASTNTERSSDGIPKLSLNSKLTAAAQAKAEDMANRNYWSHNTPEGEAPWIFPANQNYDYQKLGENLAAGFTDAQSTVNGWMGSPGHKANMLDTAFTQVGFGFANNPDYTSAGGGPMTIVVAFYGKPSVLAASTTPPPAPANAPASQPTAPSVPVATKTQPEAAKKPASEPEVPAPSTANTESRPQAVAAPPIKTSRANLALAGVFEHKLVNQILVLLLLGAAAIWASRHAFAIRRTLIHGEKFLVRHPLLDLGLLVIVAFSFLLSQTAGIIR